MDNLAKASQLLGWGRKNLNLSQPAPDAPVPEPAEIPTRRGTRSQPFDGFE